MSKLDSHIHHEHQTKSSLDLKDSKDSLMTENEFDLVRVRKKRKKHGKTKKVVLAILAVVIVMCLVIGAAVALYANSISDSMKMGSQ